MDTIVELFANLSEDEKIGTLLKLQNEQINHKNPIQAGIIIYDGKEQDNLYELLRNDEINNLLENRSVKSGGHIVIYNEYYYDVAKTFYKKHNPYGIDTQQLGLSENECDILGVKYPAFM